MISQAAGTWLGWDIPGWQCLGRNPTVEAAASAERWSCSIPIPPHCFPAD